MPTPEYKSNCCDATVTLAYPELKSDTYTCDKCWLICDVYDPASRQIDEELIKVKIDDLEELRAIKECHEGDSKYIVELRYENQLLRKVAEAAEEMLNASGGDEDWDKLREAIKTLKEQNHARPLKRD